MGYGHQRTAFQLKNFAKEWIQANDYEGIPKGDRNLWERSRKVYEFLSRFKKFPTLGEFTFSFLDFFQKIYYFYPKRDLSKPNFATRVTYYFIKKGWGKHLIEKLKAQNSKLKTNLPIVSTFFTPAFMAEYFDYPGEIFLIVCDADVSRAWAPLKPKESKIKYFVPNERVFERLQLYGVRKENIFLTGYPLPIENIGSENMEILKEDLKFRLLNLDPDFIYFSKYRELVLSKLGPLPEKSDHPLTILFSVGGAGAQREIGAKILKRLKEQIREGKIKVILSAGIKRWVRDYFVNYLKYLKIEKLLGESVEIIFEEKIEDYFEKFNKVLRKTDILWTKPSELSFYSALGIPIIVAPPIGSQEEFNMRYLLKSGFGILQENLNYLEQWLFDWLKKGYLAEAAMQGFVEGEKLGTFKILEIIKKFLK
jgi:hypothetical protein